MRFRSHFLFLATLVLAALNVGDVLADETDQPPLARDISGLIAPLVTRDGVPALAGLELEGDRIVAMGAYGVRAAGRPERVTIRDQFHLGSDTKAMTATLCAMLVEDGKLRWNSTIAGIFPELRDEMLPSYRRVTLEQLLLQRSGFPKDMPAELFARLRSFKGSNLEQRHFFVSQIVHQPPEAEPGTKFIYSNTNYAIAGAMAERATGRPWEELMFQRIFRPLHMTTAGFGSPGRTGVFDEPRGHDSAGNPLEPQPDPDNPAGIGPAGTVHCNLIDWSKFIALHLTNGRSHPGLLSPEFFDRLHEPIPTGPPDDGYAMGWIVTPRDWGGGRVLTHSGSNTMWFVTTWLAPKKDFAILVACNRAEPDQMGFKACDDLCGVLIDDFNRRHRP